MIIGQFLRVEMPDGSVWSVPIMEIALNRACWYADEFNDDMKVSLQEHTIPLFESDHYEIIDWFKNNMNWSDVSHLSRLIIDPPNVNYNDLLGEAEIEVIS